MKPNVHFLAAVPCAIPERRLVTYPCVAEGRLIRCSISSAALELLWGRPVHTEADQAEAFAACRQAIEGLTRRLLAEGRGSTGGLSVTTEDVREASGVAARGA